MTRSDTTLFADLDAASISRVLSQLGDRPDDLVDAYFERSEEITLAEDRAPGLEVRRESGLAVRLLRQDQSWIAARDGIRDDLFAEAVRRVARALPRVPYPLPAFDIRRWNETPEAPELAELVSLFRRACRGREGLGDVRLTVSRHRRWSRVIGSQVASGTEIAHFYSVTATAAWGRHGLLLERPDTAAADGLVASLARTREALGAESPAPGRCAVVLGPSATAVLLHEAVAHALEADVLSQGGNPEAAIGVEMGSSLLDVFDDPRTAPEGVRRKADDEGFPAIRRCLLRRGQVEQPICNAYWSRRSDLLLPGAGRRGDRYDAPGPRSCHLELAPGETATSELFAEAEGGLFLPEAERGYLDPVTGHFALHFPYGRRIRDQAPAEPVGSCSIHGHVSDLLHRVQAVGREARSAGAGWCAKDGIRLPVWATAPEIRLDAVEVRP